MADKDVTVRINIAPGQDTLSPAVQRQVAVLQELQRQARPSATLALGPVEAPARIAAAQPLAQRSQARALAMMRAKAPAGAALSEWQEAFDSAVQQEEEAREQARKRALTDFAHFKATGQVPESQIRAVSPGPGRSVALGAVSVLGGLSRAGGTAGREENPLFGGLARASSALAMLPGPIGAATGIFGVVASAAGGIAEGFGRAKYSLGQLMQEMELARGDLQRGRQSGAAGPEALRRALTVQEAQEYEAAERSGNVGAQRAVLQRAQNRLRGSVDQANAGLPSQAAIEQQLQGLNAQMRDSPGGPLGTIEGLGRALGGQTFAQQWRRIWRQAGVPENEIPAAPSAPMAPAQIQQAAAQAAGGRAVQAQAGLTTVTNALRPGGLPSLRPGGLSLQDLPNLFQSRQGDVLDLHSQIQQEAVRDQREEARFQAQMELWERILSAIQGGGGGGGGPFSEFWEAIRNAAQLPFAQQ